MSHVEFSVDRHIARVHLNRPEKLNAITPEMDDALAVAWNRIIEDGDIWVALLTAQGDRAFCAGADMNSVGATRQNQAFGGGLTGIGGPLVRLNKPLVAAVQGHAVGGGFELAMCADILIVSETARFSLPEVRSGLIDHGGVLHRAIRKLPYNIAMELILMGRSLPADEAVHHGLANKCVDAASLLSSALAMCEAIATAPPLATQAAKQAVEEGLTGSLEEALARNYPAIERYRSSQDCIEAMQSLKDRRPPHWIGH